MQVIVKHWNVRTWSVVKLQKESHEVEDSLTINQALKIKLNLWRRWVDKIRRFAKFWISWIFFLISVLVVWKVQKKWAINYQKVITSELNIWKIAPQIVSNFQHHCNQCGINSLANFSKNRRVKRDAVEPKFYWEISIWFCNRT